MSLDALGELGGGMDFGDQPDSMCRLGVDRLSGEQVLLRDHLVIGAEDVVFPEALVVMVVVVTAVTVVNFRVSCWM